MLYLGKIEYLMGKTEAHKECVTHEKESIAYIQVKARMCFLREHNTTIPITERGLSWQDHAEALCVIAILELVLQFKEVPNLGQDVKEEFSVIDFLPSILKPFGILAVNGRFNGGNSFDMFTAYKSAYKKVREMFPWLEQNSVQMT